MTRIDLHETHSISWVDLAAADLDGACDFYCGLMDWTTFQVDGSPYRMFMSGGEPVAGVMELTSEMGGMPPVWSVYVDVDDADESAAAAVSAGGSVAQPPFVIDEDGHRVAVIVDPAGAAICLFEGSSDNGMKIIDEPGAPCWFDCRTRNADASEAFLREVFGWSATPMEGPMDYRVLDLDGRPIAGIMTLGAEVPAEVPAHWGLAFSIADTDRAIEYVSSNGGSVSMPATDTPFGRSASLVDPWGAAFMVIDRSSAVE